MATVAQQRQVERCVRKWQRRLLLQPWTVTVVHHDEPSDTDPEAMAEAYTTHRYLTLLIRVYPHFWLFSEDERDNTICHEMVHAITDHAKTLVLRRVAKRRVTLEEAEDADEKMVEHFTSVVWKAYK